MNSTENYYNQNAETFIQNTFDADVSENIKNFISLLPKNAKILDVGCGSGRDSKTFLDLGFDVVAFDSSIVLAEKASQKINHPVLHLKIEDLSFENEFDGVWAMASLLHLPKKDFSFSLEKCLKSLKDNGKFFLSLKEGEGESVDENGRFFSYYSKDEIINTFEALGQPNVTCFSQSDKLGRNVNWLSFIVSKTPQLKLKKTKSKF